MNEILRVGQLVIALGILNVWLLRAHKETPYRGGAARNMEEEFHVYGLSTTCMKVIRVLKLSCALLLILGIVWPSLTWIGAIGMSCLMAAAVFMHIKVRDPVRKSLPAASLLMLSLFVALRASS